MICPKCGSYQPDRAKYCGICGEGLSQDGLVESFLKDKPEHEITIPRHRSFLFYLILGLIVVLAKGADMTESESYWNENEYGSLKQLTLFGAMPFVSYSIKF